MKRIPLGPTAGLAVLLEHLIQRDPGRILPEPTPERVGTELGNRTKAPNPEAISAAQAKRLRKQARRLLTCSCPEIHRLGAKDPLSIRLAHIAAYNLG